MKAQSTFTSANWKETQKGSWSQTAVTDVSADFELSGELDGIAKMYWTMYYEQLDQNDQHNSRAHYRGFAHFNGTIGGKQGSFVLEDRGFYDVTGARSILSVVEGSGTEDFASISGSATYLAGPDGLSFEIEYEL